MDNRLMGQSVWIPPQPLCCELCQRQEHNLTQHHLVPRTHHSNKRIRKLFTRAEMLTRILWVCRPCHTHIHRVLDEKQLAVQYHSRERLLQHPEIRRFVNWLGSKPAGFKPKSTPRR